MKRFLGEIIGILLIFVLAFMGCVGPKALTLNGENLDSLQDTLKRVDKFAPDKNGYKVLGIPSKENPTETYIIFKNEQGNYGFGITCKVKGTIFVMYSAKDKGWIAWANGMVMPLADQEAKDIWKDYVDEIKKVGDLSKAGRYKEPEEDQKPKPKTLKPTPSMMRKIEV